MFHFSTGPASHKTGKSAFVSLLHAAALTFVIIGSTVAGASADSNDAAIVIDAKTGKTLYESQADALRYPASLTKMMTLYLTFEALAAGKISMDTPIPVSSHAAGQEPSKLYLKPGQTITVRQVILGIVTRSANDAATAIGEFLGGNEPRFARIMTHKAHELGMSRTTFRNANGLTVRDQRTTAHDLARLAIALREHFPQYYHFFSTESFEWRGHTIGNHDHLLGTVEGVDGLKTGFTSASGFNLATSIKRNGRSVVAVVMGGRSWRARDDEMRRLLAKYVPDASTSGSGDLIAETPVARTISVLPKHGPRPQFRSQSGARIALAYANDASSDVAFPMPDPRPVVGRQALIKTLQQQEAAISAPAAAEEVRAQEPTPAPTPAVPITRAAKVDGITTSSTDATPPSGWVIQIGATPDHDSAMRLLEKAKSSNSKLLASAEPFAVSYSDDGNHMYRARFGGFNDKDSAWAACSRLKKSGYGCWATQQ